MSHNLDTFDAAILTILQRDASLSMDAIAEQVNLSRNACWRRIRLMEEAGIFKGRVVLADPKALGCGQEVMPIGWRRFTKRSAPCPRWWARIG